jgi:high-affinity nickel permease
MAPGAPGAAASRRSPACHAATAWFLGFRHAFDEILGVLTSEVHLRGAFWNVMADTGRPPEHGAEP